MLRAVIVISLLALVSPLGTAAVRVGLQQTPVGPATIDVPCVRQWFLDMLKAAPDNFQSVSGEEIRVENRARGRVATTTCCSRSPQDSTRPCTRRPKEPSRKETSST